MALVLKVGGVDKTSQILEGSLITIEQQLNERAMARFVTKPAYVPARFAIVQIYEADGTTLKFGGVVLKRTVQPIQARTEPYLTQIECGDYFTYFDWAYVTLAYTVDTSLKDILTDLIAALPATYGITLDAAQVTGPSLSPFTWTAKRVSDAIRELTDRTNYVGTISAAKVFKMFVPGTDAAPFTLTDAAPHCLGFVYADSDNVPADTFYAICGPNAQLVTTFSTTANGTDTSWEVDIQSVPSGWQQGYVSENGTTNRTISGPGGGGYYEWDETTGRGTFSVGTGATPGAGVVLTFVYTAQYPFTVIAQSSPAIPIVLAEAFPDVTDYAQGVEIAAGRLAQLHQQPRTCDFPTIDAGWLPGQALSVILTPRLTANFILTTVTWSTQIVHVTARWVASVKAIEGSYYQGSYLDAWRGEASGSGGSGVAVGTPAVDVSTIVLPVDLGGTDNGTLSAVDWVRVEDATDFFAQTTFTGRVRVELWARDSGVGVTARLYNITDAAAAATSSEVTSQTRTQTSFVAVITTGKEYQLQVKATTGAGSVYANAGSLERVA